MCAEGRASVVLPRMRPFPLFIATAVALTVACTDSAPQPVEAGSGVLTTGGVFSYSAYSTGGKKVLEGEIELFLGTDSVVSGVWSIRWVPGADTTLKVGPQVGEGVAIGYRTAEGVVLSLNPMNADDNVVLRSIVEGGGVTLAGRWTWLGFPGPLADGRFVATNGR